MPTSLIFAAIEYGISAAVGGGILGAIAAAGAGLVLNSAFGNKAKESPGAQQSLVGRSTTLRQAISPRQVIYGQVKTGGVITYIETTNNNDVLHMVVTFAGHTVEEIGDIYFNDDLVPFGVDGNATGFYAGSAYIQKSLGKEAGQPFSTLVGLSAGLWTDAHRQTGCAKIYLALTWNLSKWPNGVPNISAVIKGKNDIYDPRTTLTGYTSNSALCVANYLTDSTLGVGCDYATEIDEDLLIAAANVCDEAVALAAGGSENRYEMHGTLQSSEAPRDLIPEMLGSMQGRAVLIGGQWRLRAGAYLAPAVTLDEHASRGALKITTLNSRRDNFNAVKGVFVDPNASWQPTDFPPVTNAAYLAADGGERVWKDINLRFTKSASMAQRIAKIELERVRQQITVVNPCKLSAYLVQPPETLMLTNTRMGWSSKAFEVMELGLAVDTDDDGQPVLGVDLTLRETASTVYDWNAGEETTLDPAPNSNLPNPFQSGGSPTNVQAVSGTDELFVAGDGTVHSRILLTWNASTDAFVLSGGIVHVQMKLSSASIWQDVPALLGDAVQTYLSPVDDGIGYDLRVRFENSLSVASEWTQISHTVVGKTELPSDVDSFTIEGTRFSWSAVTDLDLAGYAIRYQPGTLRSWGGAIPLHTGLLTASPYDPLIVPTGAVTIMVKAVDTSGNESLDAAYIVTDLGDALVANVLATYDIKAAGFTGTKTLCAVSGGNLVADVIASALAWKDDDTVNAWSDDSSTLAWSVTQYGAITYVDTWTTTAALAGSQMTIQSTIVGDPWSIEYRENSAKLAWSVDSSTLAWSADSSTLAWDAPAWLPWPGTITAENTIYEFRVTTGQSTTQGVVSELTITVDAPDINEALENVVISGAGTRLALSSGFTAIENVQLTLQDDSGTAIGVKVMDKSVALGPLIKCYDAAGAATSGLVDARVQGY